MNEQSNPNEQTPPVRRVISKAFTIVLVLFLAFILVGIVSPRPHRGPMARVAAAKTQISILGTALGAFQVDNGCFPLGTNGLLYLMEKPPGATNWHGPYMERSIPMDPWGHPFIYVCPGRHNPQSYDLSATGPDGQVFGNWPQK
jgi:general secretion pathway protein G